MEWKFNSELPIYSQLIQQITLNIVSGVFPPGARLPAVRELATDAGVNPNTMQRALSELERSGLVYSQRTSGRYVTEDTELIDDAKNRLAEIQVSGFLEAMKRLGYCREEIIALINSAPKEESDHGDNGM